MFKTELIGFAHHLNLKYDDEKKQFVKNYLGTESSNAAVVKNFEKANRLIHTKFEEMLNDGGIRQVSYKRFKVNETTYLTGNNDFFESTQLIKSFYQNVFVRYCNVADARVREIVNLSFTNLMKLLDKYDYPSLITNPNEIVPWFLVFASSKNIEGLKGTKNFLGDFLVDHFKNETAFTPSLWKKVHEVLLQHGLFIKREELIIEAGNQSLKLPEHFFNILARMRPLRSLSLIGLASSFSSRAVVPLKQVAKAKLFWNLSEDEPNLHSYSHLAELLPRVKDLTIGLGNPPSCKEINDLLSLYKLRLLTFVYHPTKDREIPFIPLPQGCLTEKFPLKTIVIKSYADWQGNLATADLTVDFIDTIRKFALAHPKCQVQIQNLTKELFHNLQAAGLKVGTEDTNLLNHLKEKTLLWDLEFKGSEIKVSSAKLRSQHT